MALLGLKEHGLDERLVGTELQERAPAVKFQPEVSKEQNFYHIYYRKVTSFSSVYIAQHGAEGRIQNEFTFNHNTPRT